MSLKITDFEKGFEYLQCEVWTHKLYNIITQKHNKLEYLCQMIVFYERFLDDPECPAVARKVLLWDIGLGYGVLQEKNPSMYKIFLERKFLIQRWQEKCL